MAGTTYIDMVPRSPEWLRVLRTGADPVLCDSAEFVMTTVRGLRRDEFTYCTYRTELVKAQQ